MPSEQYLFPPDLIPQSIQQELGSDLHVSGVRLGLVRVARLCLQRLVERSLTW